MFKAIKKWWNGLWEKEPSPGPKITRDDIAKVEETIEEIRSGKFAQVKPTRTLGADYAQKSIKLDAQAAPVRPPKPKPVSADITTIERNGCVAHIGPDGKLLPLGMDHDGHMPPNPHDKTILPGIEMSFIAEPGIQLARKEEGLVQMLGETGWPYHNDPAVGKIDVDHHALEETVAERLANPQVIKIGLEDLDGDTALPTPRKPRRRGKRGGVKRNRRNKNK